MRKATYIIIAIIVLMASIDFICSFGNERTDEELFARKLDEATMLTYQDPDFGFTVRYPSFFIEQPDSLDANVGYARFSYGDYWANVILECYATRNYDLSPKAEVTLGTGTCHIKGDYNKSWHRDSRFQLYLNTYLILDSDIRFFTSIAG